MCKRLHDCSMLDSLEVQTLISELGWSAYGLLQAVLDECFKQSSGSISSTLSVLARAIRCDLDELGEVLSKCDELGILSFKVLKEEEFFEGKSARVLVSHAPTVADKEVYLQKNKRFKERASKAANAKQKKKSLTSATSTQQAGALAVLGEEEEVEEEEEEKKDLKEGGLEGESEVRSPAKQVRSRSRKPNFHPETADELPLPESLDTFEVRQALTLWLDHRAKIGKKYKSPYWLSTLAERWEGNPDGLIEALKHSAGEGYTGIFPPPASKQTPKQTVMGVSRRESETLALIEEMRRKDQETLIVEVR